MQSVVYGLVAGIVTVSLLGTGAVSALDTGTKPHAEEKSTSQTPTKPLVDKPAVQAQIAEKKEAVREKVQVMKEKVTEKLADKRLDQCLKRQDKINAIVQKRSEQAEKHLATFQKIEARVIEFYTTKNLTADDYATLLATVDEKEAAAIAAIAVTKETTFDCASTDATSPGSVVKELAKGQHAALKEYRTAIKDLIVGVKTSAADKVKETTPETGEEQ